MKTKKLILIGIFMTTSLQTLAAIKKENILIPSTTTSLSEIQNYNYVCIHVSKPEALVFKTTSPQKIWRTTLTRDGEIKKGKAFQLSQIQINGESIEKEGELASFRAHLAKDYEIKGFFSKDTDEDLPLTVVSTYIPDGGTSQIKDHYNCESQLNNRSLKLGSINKE